MERSSSAKGRTDPKRSADNVNREFPAFALPEDWDAVIQEGGAILRADIALRIMRSQAGGKVVHEAAKVEHRSDGVLVRTPTQEFMAQHAIMALGPWIGSALPEIASVIHVTRQATGWFRPSRPEATRLGQFPIFILERRPDNVVYGFPDFEGRGVKAAPHNLGPEVTANDWAPPTDLELDPVSSALAELVPGAAGPIVDRDTCLYTNTLPADLRRDRGSEFIIDRWPNSRLIVASPCSGHGAKFAPAIGERLARLSLNPSYESEPAFQLSRYSQFV